MAVSSCLLLCLRGFVFRSKGGCTVVAVLGDFVSAAGTLLVYEAARF